MKSARQILREADELDLRRQKQIANQTESINRLLEDGSYDSEMAYLHEELALAHARIEQLERDLKEARDGS